jgi:hypothetical protein
MVSASRAFYRQALAGAAAILLASVLIAARQPESARIRFEVDAAPGLLTAPVDGRLFVVLARKPQPEPRTTIGRTGTDANPAFAIDVTAFDGRRAAVIDQRAVAFPIASLAALPAGEYQAQALLDTNIDLKSVNAPGNLFSASTAITIDPHKAGIISLRLTSRVPEEALPPASEYIRYFKIQSKLLTDFYKRPIFLRAGVVLPRGYATDTTRRYPLRVRIGGYGASYTGVQRLMREDGAFRKAWVADDTPRMVLVHLDGDGPLGDPYQVNSANHGPYGDAVTRELIPHLERELRLIPEARARVLDGGSTGGWVSLALQVFYPDDFNGTWSYCPDSVDFRAFQLVNIYSDRNAFVNGHGFERPSAREISGDVRFTMRHEIEMENLLGAGDSWTMSGGQWGAWNATYGARGADGRPVALWDPKTGAIDQKAAEHWKKYDLRQYLEQSWQSLAPKLQGKINVWMGDADNYFLNNAARMLETFFAKAQPAYQGRMIFGPMQGHCWVGLTDAEIMKEMGSRTGATP